MGEAGDRCTGVFFALASLARKNNTLTRITPFAHLYRNILFYNGVCETWLIVLVLRARSSCFTHGVREVRASEDQFTSRKLLVDVRKVFSRPHPASNLLILFLNRVIVALTSSERQTSHSFNMYVIIVLQDLLTPLNKIKFDTCGWRGWSLHRCGLSR